MYITIGRSKPNEAECKSKKRLEFSQKLVIVSWLFMLVSVIASIGGEFVFQHLGYQSINYVTNLILEFISFVTIFVNAGYFTQNTIRDCSLNKYSARIDENGSKHSDG